jgi:putative membrane protein insertion efficiency factor
MSAPRIILLGAIKLYQRLVMPMFAAVFGPMGFGCRYHPTCSAYAREAVCEHGAVRGGALAIWRLCRCHPLGGHGVDPVPKGKVPEESPSFRRGLQSNI